MWDRMSNSPLLISDVRLYIHVASSRTWHVDFGNSMVGLTFHLTSKRLGGRMAHMQFSIAKQAGIAQARDEDFQKAIAGGYTHFLSLDDDMVFPMTVADRLLAHGKAIITCNYSRKILAKTPVCLDLQGNYLHSESKRGLEKIGYMGMGMTMIDIQEALKIPQPYFALMWDDKLKKMWSEDTYFSLKARDHGLDIWCDHDLSREIGHMGDFEYKFDDLTLQVNAA